MYRYATSDPFSFMYINNKFKKGERIYKNFTHQLQVSTKSTKEDAAADAADRTVSEAGKSTTVDVAAEK